MNRFPPAVGSRGRRRWPVRSLGTVAALTMLPGLLGPVAYAADGTSEPRPLGRPLLGKPRSADVSPFVPQRDKKAASLELKRAATMQADAARAHAVQNRKVTWPKNGTATLTLPAKGTAKAAPGSLPVTVALPKADKGTKASPAASSVTVNVLDQKKAAELGVKGVVLTVAGPAEGGQTVFSVGYGAFAAAYGGDWAGRLQVLRLPDCALTSPAAAKCRKRTPAEFINRRKKQTLDTRLSFTASG
ncbi:hypothetical protein ACFVZ1_23560, partial [Bacillus subtilis]